MWSNQTGVWIDALERATPIVQAVTYADTAFHHMTVSATPAWLAVAVTGATATATIARPDLLFSRVIRYRHQGQLASVGAILLTPVGSVVYSIEQPGSLVVSTVVTLTPYVTDELTSGVIALAPTPFSVVVRADLASLRQQLQLRLSQEQINASS